MRYPNGSESVLSHGYFAQIVKVRGAICTDGKARTAYVTGQPDTVWTVPAKVRVKGKTVSGFLTMAPTYKPNVLEGYIFISNKFGKNGHLLP